MFSPRISQIISTRTLSVRHLFFGQVCLSSVLAERLKKISKDNHGTAH